MSCSLNTISESIVKASSCLFQRIFSINNYLLGICFMPCCSLCEHKEVPDCIEVYILGGDMPNKGK